MGESTPSRAVSTGPTGAGAHPAATPAATPAGRPNLDGLGPQVAAVEAARARLGENLDRLDREVRGQVSQTAGKTAWKVGATGLATVTGIIVRKVMITVWKRVRHGNPPTNPAASTAWPEALAWAVATGAGIGVARLVTTRYAAALWQRITGSLPPGLEEVSP